MIGRIIAWLLGFFRQQEATPISDTLWQKTIEGLPFLACLSKQEQARLRLLAQALLAEKEFSSAGGLVLNNAICVSIAAQGCLPILNIGLEAYRGWVGIVVYAAEFVIPRSIEDEFGIVHEYDDIASGEAWEGGPLLISWRDAQMAGAGYNVVIHEFAHKLDMLNGPVDGIPPLPDDLSRQYWEVTLRVAYEDFCVQVDSAEALHREPLFDPYAAENPGEFFAVMSETFFETPQILQEEYPALYEQLAAFYQQDPVKRRHSQ